MRNEQENETKDNPIQYQTRKWSSAKMAFRPVEAAQACGVSEAYIRIQIRLGKIRAKKSGANTLILATALLDWLESLPDWRPAGTPE